MGQYDQFGEEGVGQGGGGCQDIFDMFGGGGGRRQQRGQKKGKSEVQPLNVTLEHLYNGKTRKLSVTRQVIDTSVKVEQCQECDGAGLVMKLVRMGPMVQQTRTTCGTCAGKGFFYKTNPFTEVLDIHIQKGSPDGHKVIFSEKLDEH